MKLIKLSVIGLITAFAIRFLAVSLVPGGEKLYIDDPTIQQTESKEPVFSADDIAILKEFEKASRELGVLKRMDVENHLAYIDQAAWDVSDVSGKEMLISMCSQYCAWKGEYPRKMTRVELRSFQTGKALAKFSTLSGIKYY